MAALHLDKVFKIAHDNSDDSVLTVNDMAQFIYFIK